MPTGSLLILSEFRRTVGAVSGSILFPESLPSIVHKNIQNMYKIRNQQHVELMATQRI